MHILVKPVSVYHQWNIPLKEKKKLQRTSVWLYQLDHNKVFVANIALDIITRSKQSLTYTMGFVGNLYIQWNA